MRFKTENNMMDDWISNNTDHKVTAYTSKAVQSNKILFKTMKAPLDREYDKPRPGGQDQLLINMKSDMMDQKSDILDPYSKIEINKNNLNNIKFTTDAINSEYDDNNPFQINYDNYAKEIYQQDKQGGYKKKSDFGNKINKLKIQFPPPHLKMMSPSKTDYMIMSEDRGLDSVKSNLFSKVVKEKNITDVSKNDLYKNNNSKSFNSQNELCLEASISTGGEANILPINVGSGENLIAMDTKDIIKGKVSSAMELPISHKNLIESKQRNLDIEQEIDNNNNILNKIEEQQKYEKDQHDRIESQIQEFKQIQQQKDIYNKYTSDSLTLVIHEKTEQSGIITPMKKASTITCSENKLQLNNQNSEKCDTNFTNYSAMNVNLYKKSTPNKDTGDKEPVRESVYKTLIKRNSTSGKKVEPKHKKTASSKKMKRNCDSSASINPKNIDVILIENHFTTPKDMDLMESNAFVLAKKENQPITELLAKNNSHQKKVLDKDTQDRSGRKYYEYKPIYKQEYEIKPITNGKFANKEVCTNLIKDFSNTKKSSLDNLFAGNSSNQKYDNTGLKNKENSLEKNSSLLLATAHNSNNVTTDKNYQFQSSMITFNPATGFGYTYPATNPLQQQQQQQSSQITQPQTQQYASDVPLQIHSNDNGRMQIFLNKKSPDSTPGKNKAIYRVFYLRGTKTIQKVLDRNKGPLQKECFTSMKRPYLYSKLFESLENKFKENKCLGLQEIRYISRQNSRYQPFNIYSNASPNIYNYGSTGNECSQNTRKYVSTKKSDVSQYVIKENEDYINNTEFNRNSSDKQPSENFRNSNNYKGNRNTIETEGIFISKNDSQ